MATKERHDLRSCQQFQEDPLNSWTLNSKYYSDPNVQAAEKEDIFYKNWWFVGHKNQIAEPGSYITAQVLDQEIMIVRGEDYKVRAFYNVCQHRAHELVKGAGKKKVLTCPYHAWVYGLDGKLIRARNTQDLKEFAVCEVKLREIRVEEFCSLIFVALSKETPQLKSRVEGLEDEMNKYCPQIGKLVLSKTIQYHVKSNWKVLIDNFLECYHCEPAHPDFVDLVDMDSYRNHVHGHYVSQIADEVRTTQSSAFALNACDTKFGYASWYIWPNLTVWAFPGEPQILTLQMIPTGPDTSIEILNWYFLNKDPSTEQLDTMRYMDEILQPEDIALCESVQKGLNSKGYERGRLVLDKNYSQRSEHAVYHFQRMVQEALA